MELFIQNKQYLSKEKDWCKKVCCFFVTRLNAVMECELGRGVFVLVFQVFNHQAKHYNKIIYSLTWILIFKNQFHLKNI